MTGRYVESINSDSEFDKFSFPIPLYARIEDMTLVIVRYSVAGQAFWDNKNGANYMATFTMGKAAPIFPRPRDIPRLAQQT